MALLAKLFAWAENGSIVDTEWTSEFQQIIDLLNGTSTTVRGYIVFSDATLPVLRINQTGAGPILELQQAGATKLSVNNSGQLVSAVTTGTAPMTIASTTKVTNLNADLFDDLNSTVFVRNETAGQQVKSAFTLAANASGENLTFTLDANTLTITRTTGGATIASISSLASATRVLNLPSTLQCQSAFTPTAATDLIRKTDLDGTRTYVYSTFILAPAASTVYGGFIAGGSGTVTHSLIQYNAGAHAGTTQIVVKKNGSTHDTYSLLTGATINTTITNNFADLALVTDDIVTISTGTDGGHDELTVALVITV